MASIRDIAKIAGVSPARAKFRFASPATIGRSYAVRSENQENEQKFDAWKKLRPKIKARMKFALIANFIRAFLCCGGVREVE